MKSLNQMLSDGHHTAVAVYVALVLKAGRREALTLTARELGELVHVGSKRNTRKYLQQLEDANWIGRDVVGQGRKRAIQIRFPVKPRIEGLTADVEIIDTEL